MRRVSFAGDDTTLVAAALQGRPEAKAELVNRYLREVERSLAHVLGFDHDLADPLQETYARAFASLQTLRDASALRCWLMSVASRTAHYLIRNRARLYCFVDDAEAARHEPAASNADVQAVQAVRAVYSILEGFSAEQRVAFTLRFVDAMNVAEVAAMLGVSHSTAKRRIRRVQARFLACARRQPHLADWLERDDLALVRSRRGALAAR